MRLENIHGSCSAQEPISGRIAGHSERRCLVSSGRYKARLAPNTKMRFGTRISPSVLSKHQGFLRASGINPLYLLYNNPTILFRVCSFLCSSVPPSPHLLVIAQAHRLLTRTHIHSITHLSPPSWRPMAVLLRSPYIQTTDAPGHTAHISRSRSWDYHTKRFLLISTSPESHGTLKSTQYVNCLQMHISLPSLTIPLARSRTFPQNLNWLSQRRNHHRIRSRCPVPSRRVSLTPSTYDWNSPGCISSRADQLLRRHLVQQGRVILVPDCCQEHPGGEGGNGQGFHRCCYQGDRASAERCSAFLRR